MSITLRPYQEQIISEARELMAGGVRTIVIQAPTGSGKTALTAKMLGNTAAKGLVAWFVCHRRELIKQSVRTFNAAGISAGIVSAGFPFDPRFPIQIASIQTLAKRYLKMTPPKLIVWDEAHHIAAASWSRIHKAFPSAFHIGLTATPERLDGAGLREWFREMVTGPTVAWLIENKFLAPYRLYAPSGVDVSGMRTSMGDFVKSDLSAAVDKPTITGDAIKHYLKYAAGKRAVVFCVSVEHSKHVVTQFLAAGIPAAHVDGETNVDERDNAIKDFERGQTLVLSNVELFGEGFDLPAIEAAILLRPTKSLGLHLQQCGRVLRPNSGKVEAIILDHAGNTQRHGLPDEDRTWSLDGRPRSKKSGDGPHASVRICPKCFAAQYSGKPACGFCKHVFAIDSRQVDQVDGELVEVDPSALRQQRAREQGGAQSLQDLIDLGRRRGYRHPERWAHHVFQARQAAKLAGVRA